MVGLPPQPLKPRRIGRRVPDSVLNIAVSKVILNKPRIRPLIDQGEAAGVVQHVRMRLQGQARPLTIGANRQPHGLAVERLAPLAHKKRVGVGLHLRPHRQPGLDGPQFLAP